VYGVQVVAMTSERISSEKAGVCLRGRRFARVAKKRVREPGGTALLPHLPHQAKQGVDETHVLVR
jgi:cell division FtsZ-interacting protein ZapD